MRVALVLGVCVVLAGACSSFEEGTDPTTGPGDGGTTPDGNTAPDATIGTNDASTDAGVELDPLLLAHWKLDDNGDVAADEVGENPGMRNGGSWTTGRIDGGFATGGMGIVTVPIGPRIVPRDVFTIAMWVNLDEKPGDDSFVFAHGYSFSVKLNSRTPQLTIGGGYYQGSRDVLTGGWHHLTVTFDAGVPQIWVDGLLSVAAVDMMPPSTRPAPSTDPIILGSNSGGGGNSLGVIDDVRFYGRVLTQTEIAQLANPK